MIRTEPNIIITGTPGVGKTSHCEELSRTTGLKHLSINQVVKQRGCHEGFDAEHQSYIVDEDKVIAHIRYTMQKLTHVESATGFSGE